METIGYILLLALSGLLIGALARLVLPGRDPMTIPGTMLVGIAGSTVAGLIAYYALDRRAPGFLLALLCSVGLVFAIRRIRERGERARFERSGGYTSLGNRG